MSGQRGEVERMIEKFGEEAVKAGATACRDLRMLAAEQPDLLGTVVDTLPGLVESWAAYQLGLAEMLEDPDRIREMLDALPSIIFSLMVSTYGPDAGVPLSVLLLIPAAPLMRVIGRCGWEAGEDEHVVPPRSGWEARFRATIVEAQSAVYRVYFELYQLQRSLGGEEAAGQEDNLWRPRELRLLYI